MTQVRVTIGSHPVYRQVGLAWAVVEITTAFGVCPPEGKPNAIETTVDESSVGRDSSCLGGYLDTGEVIQCI
jgi:hypothetical protein